MGIALLALAVIPYGIAVIAIFVGIILIIFGKTKDKKALFVIGLISSIIGGIIVVLYKVFLYWQVFGNMFTAMNVFNR